MSEWFNGKQTREGATIINPPEAVPAPGASGSIHRVEMLGGLRALGDQRDVRHFRTVRGGLLLCRLALSRGRSLSRDSLGEMLWPDDDPTAQRNRLRYELSVLRSILGPDVLVRAGNSLVALAPEITMDVAEFEQTALLVARAPDGAGRLPHLRRALELYGGELLPGLATPESGYETEDWLVRERARLAELHYDLITRFLLDADPAEAAPWSRRAAFLYPERPLPQLSAPSLPAGPLEVREGGSDGWFGRDTERALLRGWLHEEAHLADADAIAAPLLTVTGLGGVGKTRLIASVLPAVPHVFVPLDGVTGMGDDVWVAVFRSLGLSADAHRSPRHQVVAELAQRGNSVLALDGAEHLLRPLLAVIRELRDACPRLRILVTSRRSLTLSGERVMEIKPLPAPAATALFLFLARRHRPDFASTAHGEALSAEIAALLEGIPLALELAAARAVVLGPAQMRDQLTRQLRFLVSVRPRSEKKHQSLRASLAWSVSLLGGPIKAAFCALSIFPGAFGFEAAEAVLPADFAPVDALEELRLHSLLEARFDPRTEEAQYRLLTPVAEFARELLTLEQRTEVAHRHLAFFEGEAARLPPLLRSQWQEASRLLFAHLSNFRAATLFAVEEGDAWRVLRLLEGLGLPYMELGLWQDFEALAAQTETLIDALPPSPALTSVLGWRAALARRRGQNDRARLLFERRLRAFAALGDLSGQANTYFEIAGQAVDEGNADAANAALHQGRTLYQAAGLSGFVLTDHVLTARVAAAVGETNAARAGVKLALATLHREAEAPDQTVVYAHTYLSAVLIDIGAQDVVLLEQAASLLVKAIAICEQEARGFGLGVLLYEWHRLKVRGGEIGAAKTALSRATEIHEGLESRHAVRYRDVLNQLKLVHPD